MSYVHLNLSDQKPGDFKREDDCETGGNKWKRVWYA